MSSETVTETSIVSSLSAGVCGIETVIETRVQAELVTETIGPRGRQGEPGPPGQANATTHTQSTPAATWIITHGFGRLPFVSIFTMDGEEFEADVHASDQSVTIIHGAPKTGRVVLI